MTPHFIQSEAGKANQQNCGNDYQGTPEEVARVRDVRGGVLGRIGEALERTRRAIDRRHQMCGDVHQIHRDPFGRQPPRRRGIVTGERLLIDGPQIII